MCYAFTLLQGLNFLTNLLDIAWSQHGQFYIAEPNFLDCFSDCTLDYSDAKRFVVKTYSPKSSLSNMNDFEVELFHRKYNLEKLPPTYDALMLHFKRCKHVVMIWMNATVPQPVLSSPEESGWELTNDGYLVPVLMTTAYTSSLHRDADLRL